MDKTSSKLLAGFKYVYLIIFFALLAGFFYPLITDTSFIGVIIGVLILFLGLAGGILLYRSTLFEKKKNGMFVSLPDGIILYKSPIPSKYKRMPRLLGGFTLILISLYYIFQLTGRA